MTPKLHILLVGPAPVNIGGVSMHLARLMALLNDDCQFDFIDEGRKRHAGYFNLRSLNLWHYFRSLMRADLIHLHSGPMILRAFHIIVARLLLRRRVVVTVHHDIHVERHQAVTRWLLARCNGVITVNQPSHDYLSQPSTQYLMQPAFLPPVVDSEPALPQAVTQWLSDARAHAGATIMVGNASFLSLVDGVDLYGLDMCLKLMHRLLLEEKRDNYYLVFILGDSTRNVERLEQYRQQLPPLDNHFLLWEGTLSFVRLAQAADIVLRPTTTDGDALTVREALYLNRRVVASDAVPRPQGTITFTTRDDDDFYRAVTTAQSTPAAAATAPAVDYRALYLNFYRKALGLNS